MMCVTIGRCKISWLFFDDDLVLLASSEFGLQHAIISFAAACGIAGMKISTSKIDVLHLSRNKSCPMFSASWRCSLSLKKMEKLKYLGNNFTSGRKDEELDVRSGKASAVIRALNHSVVLKRELSRKAKLSVFTSKSLFVPFSPMVMNVG